MESVVASTAHYHVKVVACACGCSTAMHFVCEDDNRWSMAAGSSTAAIAAASLLNSGCLTENELAALWCVDDDDDELPDSSQVWH